MPEQDSPSIQRTLSTFRDHLVLTGLIATGSFAIVVALAVFVPLAAQLQRAPLDREIAPGLAEHFLFLHAALWPLVLLSLISSVVSAAVLFQRMRSPLVRFVRCFEMIRNGYVPEPLVIRSRDYLWNEALALNQMMEGLAEKASSREKATQRFEELVGVLSGQGVDAILLEDLTEIVHTCLDSPTRNAA